MSKRFARLRRNDAGLAVAEYAVATIAVCAFAALLFKVLTSGAVENLVFSVIKKALSALF